MLKPLHRQQFEAYLASRFEVPEGYFNDRFWSHCVQRHCVEIERWLTRFYEEVYTSHFGYSAREVHTRPELEDGAVSLLRTWGCSADLTQRALAPAVCLTHDIDYLYPTMQMRLKGMLAHRRVPWRWSTESYCTSLERLLCIDSEFCAHRSAVTLFVATRKKPSSLMSRLRSWLIDPSYDLGAPSSSQFLSFLHACGCEVGIHGSLASLSEGLLEGERLKLENLMQKAVRVGRQHWLHLPGRAPFETIHNAGIRIDSSVGWNGCIGFRAGISHPFPIVLASGEMLWELPLVIMDGNLFGNHCASSDEAVKLACSLLEQVKVRGGCVALDWHERAACPELGWDDAYLKILSWLRHNAFECRGIHDAVESWQSGSSGAAADGFAPCAQ